MTASLALAASRAQRSLLLVALGSVSVRLSATHLLRLPSSSADSLSRVISSSTYSTSRYPRGARFARTPPSTFKPTAASRTKEPRPLLPPSSQPHPTPPPPPPPLGVVDPSVYTTAIVPKDANNVLQPQDPQFDSAVRLLSQSALVVTREIEMLNLFVGYEQANRYSIHTPTGELVGYLAEQETGLLGGALQRQLFRTHRPFQATIMDTQGKPVLMIKRPFTFINSKSSIYAVRASFPTQNGPPQDQDLELIGEVHQKWHLYKRRYELFLRRTADVNQPPSASPVTNEDDHLERFAQIDAGFLSWSFLLQDAEQRLVGVIDRNFRGFGRELFTDTGQYVLRFDSVGEYAMTDARIQAPSTQQEVQDPMAGGRQIVESHGSRPLTLDERAVAMATAVSIDFDFFSRHSTGHGGGMFPWFYMGGFGGDNGQVAEADPSSTGQLPSTLTQHGDDAFGAGVMGGAMGSATDYPYPPLSSGSSDDPPPASFYPELQPDSFQDTQNQAWPQEHTQDDHQDVWGTGSSDPWQEANQTEQDQQGVFGNWGGFFPDSDDGSEW